MAKPQPLIIINGPAKMVGTDLRCTKPRADGRGVCNKLIARSANGQLALDWQCERCKGKGKAFMQL